jgi:hypothetical protein
MARNNGRLPTGNIELNEYHSNRHQILSARSATAR